MKIKDLIVILFLSHGLFSQNKYGQIVVTPGVSYNLFRGVYKPPFFEYDKSFKFTLGQQLHLDYALFMRFSIGVGFTYQKQSLIIHNYEYFEGLK